MTLEQMKSRMMFAQKVADNAQRAWNDIWDTAWDWAEENLQDHPDKWNYDVECPIAAHATRVSSDAYEQMYDTLRVYEQAKAEYETAARVGEIA